MGRPPGTKSAKRKRSEIAVPTKKVGRPPGKTGKGKKRLNLTLADDVLKKLDSLAKTLELSKSRVIETLVMNY
jgi:hypothetical protein